MEKNLTNNKSYKLNIITITLTQYMENKLTNNKSYKLNIITTTLTLYMEKKLTNNKSYTCKFKSLGWMLCKMGNGGNSRKVLFVNLFSMY
jgi:hypothetical protein